MISKAAQNVDRLRRHFRGQVVLPASPDYDRARRVWNGAIDRRPAMIARCVDVRDVRAALGFARDEGLLVAVRGGGHNVAGLSTCDDGIVVDLGPMKGMRIDAAARTGQVLSVYHNRRFDGDFLTVRSLVESGVLGPIDSLESRFEIGVPLAEAWREDIDQAGGPHRDLGAHLVDQALLLFGDPVRVFGQLERRRPGTAVDDSAFVAIEHAGGERSRLWTSLIAPWGRPRFRVRGLAAEYVKDERDPQEERVLAGGSPSDPGFGDDAPDHWGVLYAIDRDPVRVPTEGGDYRRYYEGFRDAIRGAGAVPVDVAGADFYTVSGQKWLCGPELSGALVVPDAASLVPRLAGYPGAESYDVAAGTWEPKAGARRFDPSFGAASSLAGFEAALTDLPAGRYERAAELAGRCRALLLEHGHDVVTAPGQATLVSWRQPGDTAASVASLYEQGVVVRELPGTGLLRASVGWWNDESDLERLVAGIAEL